MSKTLWELRIEKGMTLAELAAALGCAVMHGLVKPAK